MIDVADKERQALDPELKDLLEREEEEARDFIYCSTCSAVIGRQADRIEVNGGHEHSFTNPFGYHFHIGCYGEALGCSISGVPEVAESWFVGFQWRFASCAECRRHLGWYFDRVTPGSESQFFYGLILDRIQHE